MDIKIYSVGGTIDKVYFDKLSAYEVGEPVIRKVLNDLNLNINYSIESILRKDSLDMSASDRTLICSKLKSCKTKHILLTHGTDTMIDTARFLKVITGKTIVLTGAMEPALFKTSDAVFNIGGALIACQILPPGIYICMNGRIFDPDHVRKNRDKGVFESL